MRPGHGEPADAFPLEAGASSDFRRNLLAESQWLEQVGCCSLMLEG